MLTDALGHDDEEDDIWGGEDPDAPIDFLWTCKACGRGDVPVSWTRRQYVERGPFTRYMIARGTCACGHESRVRLPRLAIPAIDWEAQERAAAEAYAAEKARRLREQRRVARLRKKPRRALSKGDVQFLLRLASRATEHD